MTTCYACNQSTSGHCWLHSVRVVRLAIAAVLLSPALAFAQAAQPAPSTSQALGSLLGSLLAALFSPSGLAFLFGAATLVLGAFGAKAVIWKQRFALLVKHGFDLVEDLNSDPELKGKLDKEAAGLKAINDLCLANGWRPLKPGEVEAAKLGFKALNGQAEAQTAIQAKALLAAGAVAPSPK